MQSPGCAGGGAAIYRSSGSSTGIFSLIKILGAAKGARCGRQNRPASDAERRRNAWELQDRTHNSGGRYDHGHSQEGCFEFRAQLQVTSKPVVVTDGIATLWPQQLQVSAEK